MNAGQFARKRGRIESSPRKRNGWHKRALMKLIHEADAVPVFVNRKLVAYRLAGGQHVCLKQRYTNLWLAERALSAIRRHSYGAKIPQRAYQCPYCLGAHLTSKAVHRINVHRIKFPTLHHLQW